MVDVGRVIARSVGGYRSLTRGIVRSGHRSSYSNLVVCWTHIIFPLLLYVPGVLTSYCSPPSDTFPSSYSMYTRLNIPRLVVFPFRCSKQHLSVSASLGIGIAWVYGSGHRSIVRLIGRLIGTVLSRCVSLYVFLFLRYFAPPDVCPSSYQILISCIFPFVFNSQCIFPPLVVYAMSCVLTLESGLEACNCLQYGVGLGYSVVQVVISRGRSEKPR